MEVREAMERARPKSQTFTRQSELSNMLDGCSTHTHTTHRHRHSTRCLTVSAYSRAYETQALKEAVVGALRGPRCLGVSLFFIFFVCRCGGRRCLGAAADVTSFFFLSSFFFRVRCGYLAYDPDMLLRQCLDQGRRHRHMLSKRQK